MITELRPTSQKLFTLIIPVYKNSANIPGLLAALQELKSVLAKQLQLGFEVIFVVDGSPDDSFQLLKEKLTDQPYQSTLMLLSRNFGSFAAIRAGFEKANGDFFAVMAADLQEPPELILEFARILSHAEADVVVGLRTAREDPLMTRICSNLFWAMYRKFIQPEFPPGGVDIFGGTREVLGRLGNLQEHNSSLVGLLFWVGYKRREVPYQRRKRLLGESAWTVKKKVRYLLDSIFNFTDLPIRLLLAAGVCGIAFSLIFAALVVATKVFSTIPVPGYTATVIVVSFFGGLNSLGLGLVGGYVWRTFENTKQRPNFIVATVSNFAGSTFADGKINQRITTNG